MKGLPSQSCSGGCSRSLLLGVSLQKNSRSCWSCSVTLCAGDAEFWAWERRNEGSAGFSPRDGTGLHISPFLCIPSQLLVPFAVTGIHVWACNYCCQQSSVSSHFSINYFNELIKVGWATKAFCCSSKCSSQNIRLMQDWWGGDAKLEPGFPLVLMFKIRFISYSINIYYYYKNIYYIYIYFVSKLIIFSIVIYTLYNIYYIWYIK